MAETTGMSRDAPSARAARIDIDPTGMSGPRKLFVKSYGCQMNVYDSHRMADVLAPHGYVETAAVEDADLVILNTCHIREKAAEKVYSELGRIRKLKDAAARHRRDIVVAVAGCVAQAEAEEIVRRAPVVDVVVGPQSYHRLPALLARAAREGHVVDTDFPIEDKFDHLATPSRAATRARGVSAFVTVQEGCDKFCSFCVVPYTRGAEVSRPVVQVVAEVERLAEAGVREITLIGQNVNAYHGEGPHGRPWPLGRLLHRVAEVPGIARLRYTTSHPRDMEPSLIAAHRELPSLMPEDFRETVTLVDEVGFAGAFSFKYSPRPGTPAALADQVPEEIKATRLQRLQQAIDRHQAAFNARALGMTFDVLLEKPGRHPGQLVGRSPYLQPVQVTASADMIGEIVAVTISEIAPNSLFGVLDGPAARAAGRQPAFASPGA